MPITTGGFDDLVQLSQDTLHYVGPDLEIGNTSVGSTASIGFNNTAGNLVLAGVATGNATVNLPQGGGTLLTNVNLSAGTTSNNLSAVTFANSNGVTFGLNASTVTASHAINLSAGTTSNNLSAVTFANSNGISFGLNASTVTVVYGGFSSWSNGPLITTAVISQATLLLQPVIVPYAISANTLQFLLLISNLANLSTKIGFSISAGLYTINAGNTGTLSVASSTTQGYSLTSAAVVGNDLFYFSIPVTWNLTPGPYVFGFALSTGTTGTAAGSVFGMSLYGTQSNLSVIQTGETAAISNFSNMVFPGYSQASVTGLPSSVGITNTASYIRSGAQPTQPWFLLQGT